MDGPHRGGGEPRALDPPSDDQVSGSDDAGEGAGGRRARASGATRPDGSRLSRNGLLAARTSPSLYVGGGGRQRAIRESGLPIFDFVAFRIASAASRSASDAGDDGSRRTIGAPASAPSRSAGTRGTCASKGTSSVSAARRPPPSPNRDSRSPQCGHT